MDVISVHPSGILLSSSALTIFRFVLYVSIASVNLWPFPSSYPRIQRRAILHNPCYGNRRDEHRLKKHSIEKRHHLRDLFVSRSFRKQIQVKLASQGGSDYVRILGTQNIKPGVIVRSYQHLLCRHRKPFTCVGVQ